LEYTASGLVFLTNDGDLAAEMLKHWSELEQVYFVKVKGMLTLEELERLGKEIGVRMKTVRQPDATRRRARHGGRAANYWYEVRMRDTKKEETRNVLFREGHPVEKMKRIGLGPLTVEGVAEGTYEMLQESEVEKLRRALQGGKEIKEVNEVKEKRKDSTQRSQRAEAQRKAGREQKQIPRTA
jgi:23S rRNA pseudouridine2605 synthase